MRGDGQVYMRGNKWWIVYFFRGERFRESAGDTEQEARKKLKNRMKEIYGDRFVGPAEERLTVKEILDGYITHLKAKGARSIKSVESHLVPVREFFALCRAVDVTPTKIERLVEQQIAAKYQPATVNRQIGALRQALNLARKQNRLGRVPYFSKLKEDNAREGFFERAEFEAVAAELPEPLDDIARFAYLSGWRKGEILPLTWEAVDRAAGEVRLRTSKNGRGRVLPLAGELASLIEKRWRARPYTTRESVEAVSSFVFHRRGRPIVDFKKVWVKACDTAKVPGRLFHDLRRTAVRDMVRAGVPQAVAMSISGHRTMSMFTRYNITSGEDMRSAIERTGQYRATMPAERNIESIPGKDR